MSVGTYISVLGHVGLIGWVLVGDPFPQSDPEPMEQTTEVSVISADVFDILMNNTPPDVGLVGQAPAPQVTLDEAPQMQPVSEPPPTQADVSQTPPADSDAVPTERPTRPVQPQATQTAPQGPTAPPVDVAPSNPTQVSERPQMRPEDRVAPVAVAPPPPDVDLGNVLRDAVQPAAEPEDTPLEPEQTAEAPEAATERIVTEAEQAPVNSAPLASLRPQLRPADLAPTPDPEPVAETPAAEPQAAPSADAVTALLEQALANTGAAARPQTLSVAEAQGLNLAIGFCWNSGSLSTDALQTTVTVDVEFSPDGRPIRDSIRLYGFQGGNRVGAARAFEAAKRAILECGQAGYDLPENIYDVWRYMRLDFNPENMRIK